MRRHLLLRSGLARRDERTHSPYPERGARRDPPGRSTRELVLTLVGGSGEALPTNAIVRLVREADPSKQGPSIKAEIARMTEMGLLRRVGRIGRGFTYAVGPGIAEAGGRRRHVTSPPPPTVIEEDEPLRWPGEPTAARIRDLVRAADRLAAQVDGPLHREQYAEAVRLLRRSQALADEVISVDFVPERSAHPLAELVGMVRADLAEAERRLYGYPDDVAPRLIARGAHVIEATLRRIGRRDPNVRQEGARSRRAIDWRGSYRG